MAVLVLGGFIIGAIFNAFIWVLVKPFMVTHGTSVQPIFLTAMSLPWPAIIPFSSSNKIGLVNPNSLIELIIWLICSSECVLLCLCRV